MKFVLCIFGNDMNKICREHVNDVLCMCLVRTARTVCTTSYNDKAKIRIWRVSLCVCVCINGYSFGISHREYALIQSRVSHLYHICVLRMVVSNGSANMEILFRSIYKCDFCSGWACTVAHAIWHNRCVCVCMCGFGIMNEDKHQMRSLFYPMHTNICNIIIQRTHTCSSDMPGSTNPSASM